MRAMTEDSAPIENPSPEPEAPMPDPEASPFAVPELDIEERGRDDSKIEHK